MAPVSLETFGVLTAERGRISKGRGSPFLRGRDRSRTGRVKGTGKTGEW